MAKVFFLPSGRSVEINNNETIMKAAQMLKIDLGGFCNGNGTCKKCEVEVIEKGKDKKNVLACKYVVEEDIIVKTSEEKKYDFDSLDTKIVYPKNVGAAIDVGTTSIVISLFDLETKKEFRRISELNRQVLYGADVISRIKFSLEEEKNISELQNTIISQINDMIGYLGKSSKITEYVISGNTAMSHFLLGIKPIKLGISPFEPSYTGSYEGFGVDLGLKYKEAKCYIVSNIKSHVGGDILSGLMTIKKQNGLNVFVDIGTNGEIVVFNDSKMLCTSTAMGPALEGSQISCGMRAYDGAIEKISIKKGIISYKTINDTKPIGICGSGIISIVHELLKSELIDKTGRIVSGEKLIYIDKDSNIFISQDDIRKVQLAKAALISGILTLINKMGKEVSDVDNLYIAGEFGRHIDLESAIGIGLLPCINNIIRIGNSSLDGSGKILFDLNLKKESELLANRIEHIELAEDLNFTMMYTKSMWF